MSWLLLALLCAVLHSVVDVAIRKYRSRYSNIVTCWAMVAGAAFYLGVINLFLSVPQIDKAFVYVLLVASGCDVLGMTCYVTSLRKSDLSLMVPLYAFQPALVLCASALLLGEFPPLLGILGILLLVIGVYTLNISKVEVGLLEPIRVLYHESGTKFMVVAVMLTAISCTLHKVGIQSSSIYFWPVAQTSLTCILFTIVIGVRDRSRLSELPKAAPLAAVLGIFIAAVWISQMIAISLTYVAYVMSVKRISILITAFFGYLLFKEENPIQRLTGCLFVVAGVALIAL